MFSLHFLSIKAEKNTLHENTNSLAYRLQKSYAGQKRKIKTQAYMESSWLDAKIITSSTDAAAILDPKVECLFQGRPVRGDGAFGSKGARHLGG